MDSDFTINVEVTRVKLSTTRQNTADYNDPPNQVFINVFKIALSKAISKNEKTMLLTTLPNEWSVRKIQKEFQVSRRIVSNAKKIRQSRGYLATPNGKSGRPLSDSIIEKVTTFYTSDEWSRFLPSRKDCITISENGVRETVQKRLLLLNINKLHAKFNENNPEIKISLSTFTKFRPRFCLPVGSKGTHNVCV